MFVAGQWHGNAMAVAVAVGICNRGIEIARYPKVDNLQYEHDKRS